MRNIAILDTIIFYFYVPSLQDSHASSSGSSSSIPFSSIASISQLGKTQVIYLTVHATRIMSRIGIAACADSDMRRAAAAARAAADSDGRRGARTRIGSRATGVAADRRRRAR